MWDPGMLRKKLPYSLPDLSSQLRLHTLPGWLQIIALKAWAEGLSLYIPFCKITSLFPSYLLLLERVTSSFGCTTNAHYTVK